MGNLVRTINVLPPTGAPILYPLVNEKIPLGLNGYAFTDYIEGVTNALLRVRFPVMYMASARTAKMGVGEPATGISTDSDLNILIQSKILPVPYTLTTNRTTFNTHPDNYLCSVGSITSIDDDIKYGSQSYKEVTGCDVVLSNPNFPQTDMAISWIIDISGMSITAQTDFATICFRNPQDEEILDSNNPWYKYAVRAGKNTDFFSAIHVYNTNGNDIHSNVTYVVRTVNDGSSSIDRPVGSIFRLTDVSNKRFEMQYPWAPIGNGVIGGDYYENQESQPYVRSYVYLVDFSALTGNIPSKLTIRVSSSVGSMVYVASMYGYSDGEYIDVTSGATEGNAVQVYTGTDYEYTFNINALSTKDIDSYPVMVSRDSMGSDSILDIDLISFNDIGNVQEYMVEHYNYSGQGYGNGGGIVMDPDMNSYDSVLSKVFTSQLTKFMLRDVLIVVNGVDDYTVEYR